MQKVKIVLPNTSIDCSHNKKIIVNVNVDTNAYEKIYKNKLQNFLDPSFKKTLVFQLDMGFKNTDLGLKNK